MAAWAVRLGLTRALESLPRRRLLIALNYHRIGNVDEAAFDPEVYSATAEDFDWQVAYLKSRFGVVTLEEAVDWVARPGRAKGTPTLITFDDGYLDNFRVAFPVLRSHGVQATFFLPTSFVGTNRLPWWDRMAHAVRRTSRDRLHVEHGARVVDIDLAATSQKQALRDLLSVYKSLPAGEAAGFLTAVETACEAPPAPVDRLFVDWTEAAQMIAGGMAIASHTHRHELLSRLPYQEQLVDLQTSREILERQLGIRADILAYPVGGRSAFNADTSRALKEAGYRAAFSYYGGVNEPGRTDTYDIRRIPVDSDLGLSLFRLRLALAGSTGRELI